MIDNISVVIISKNAGETIKVTLDSLKDFEEVIVFDTGSIDETLNIIKSYPNTSTYTGKFHGFGDSKNYAVSLANNDWVLSLDSDESVSEDLILDLKSIDLHLNLVGRATRKNFFMGREMIYGGWGRDKIIRLFNRNDFNFSSLKVHEKVEIDSSAEIVNLNGFINHNSIYKLSQTLEKANLYSDLYAEENNKIYPLLIIIIKVLFSFFRTYFLQKAFLAGWRGFVLSFSNAIGVFYKYMKIYVKNK
jgi:glycosyltransferase involved in cell wall biosynthesis